MARIQRPDRDRNHYQPVIPAAADSPFVRGQLDKAEGRPYDCRYTNCDDRQDYLMGFNSRVDPNVVKVVIPDAGPRRVNRRAPGPRTRLCQEGES